MRRGVDDLCAGDVEAPFLSGEAPWWNPGSR